MAAILQIRFSNVFSRKKMLNFVPVGPTSNKFKLFQIMACHKTGYERVSVRMMAYFIYAYVCR